MPCGTAKRNLRSMLSLLTMASRQWIPTSILLGSFSRNWLCWGWACPKQAVAARLADSGVPCLVVCGGAILDFLGGKVTRAPQWVRRIGCSGCSDSSLSQSDSSVVYVMGNPLFLLRTFDLQSSLTQRVF